MLKAIINYKYKSIVISVIVFLLLNVGIFILNEFISTKVSEDAVKINLAGQQQARIQSITKLALQADAEYARGNDIGGIIKTLFEQREEFSNVVRAFSEGGIVYGINNEEINVTPLQVDEGRLASSLARPIWNSYAVKVDVLTQYFSNRTASKWANELEALTGISGNDDSSGEEVITNLVDFTVDNNEKLTETLTNMANTIEKSSVESTAQLRLAHTVGVGLALVNFVFIIFYSLRHLRRSDQREEVAKQETKDILDTVNEGLFLLDKDMEMGEQRSKELDSIFGTEMSDDVSFTNFIRNYISPKDFDNFTTYINLLFDSSKKIDLMGDLNPLRKVAIQVPDPEKGTVDNKFLKFSFSRVKGDDEDDKLLTTVTDITQEVLLTQQLEDTKKRNEEQLEMLSVLLSGDAEMAPRFIESSQKSYDQVNNILKNSRKEKSSYNQIINEIFALIHGVKGEAAAMSLNAIASLCHDFEENLKQMKNNVKLTGQDFLSLTVILDELIGYNENLKAIYEKISPDGSSISTIGSGTKAESDNRRDWDHLKQLANNVAARQGKDIEIMTSGLNDVNLSEDFYNAINQVSIQLIRNSITHGIETQAIREGRSKPAAGMIKIQFLQRANGDYEYIFTDDGQGIDLDKVLSSAIERNIISRGEAETLTQYEVLGLIFSADISTNQSADMDSGQGVGLYAVKKLVSENDGKIKIKTKMSGGCSFIISFPPTSNKLQQAA